MGFREQWSGLGTGVKILIGLGVLAVVIPVFLVLSAVVASFVLGFGDSGAASAPQASWEFDYTATNASSGELAITHDGGEAVDASRLTIEVDYAQYQWKDGDGSVTNGDSTTVEAGPDDAVTLLWERNEETRIMATYGP